MPEEPATDSRAAVFLAALRDALPDLDLSVDRAETAAFRYDETEYTYPGWPLAVALPAYDRGGGDHRRAGRRATPCRSCRAAPAAGCPAAPWPSTAR